MRISWEQNQIQNNTCSVTVKKHKVLVTMLLLVPICMYDCTSEHSVLVPQSMFVPHTRHTCWSVCSAQRETVLYEEIARGTGMSSSGWMRRCCADESDDALSQSVRHDWWSVMMTQLGSDLGNQKAQLREHSLSLTECESVTLATESRSLRRVSLLIARSRASLCD